MVTIVHLLGADMETATAEVKDIIAFETELAKVTKAIICQKLWLIIL